MDLLVLLAHAGHGHGVDGGAIALAAIAIAAMVIPFLVLAGIGRVFWRSWKREQAEGPPGEGR